jgi:hypothetical protein
LWTVCGQWFKNGDKQILHGRGLFLTTVAGVLKDVEMICFDPGGGETPPLLALILLVALVRRKFGKKF